MPEISQEEVRNCIRGFMNANGITQQDLADRTGLSLQTISNYLSKSKLSEKTIERFAVALGYPYELLRSGIRYYGGNEKPSAYELLEARVSRLEEVLRQHGLL